jgi:hypothetical protein
MSERPHDRPDRPNEKTEGENMKQGFPPMPYESFLPADARPPLEINEKLMNQYRHLMEEFYVEQ